MKLEKYLAEIWVLNFLPQILSSKWKGFLIRTEYHSPGNIISVENIFIFVPAGLRDILQIQKEAN